MRTDVETADVSTDVHRKRPDKRWKEDETDE